MKAKKQLTYNIPSDDIEDTINKDGTQFGNEMDNINIHLPLRGSGLSNEVVEEKEDIRVLPLISYFSYIHYHINVLYSYIITTVFNLLERYINLVLRLALLGSWHSHYMVAT